MTRIASTARGSLARPASTGRGSTSRGRVCIGIHVHSRPDQLRATLEAVRAHTERPVDLILLPDGPDAETTGALASLRDIQQSATPTAMGAAACFNRLAASSDADLIIFLESGAVVGPRWLDHLLAALDADPRHSLAGPSTNRAWNEQAVFQRAGGSLVDVQRTARRAEERFGSTWQTLEPLYSLSDFCYAVRREVLETLGAADESYGLGPCWEMDYNIRADRAGFAGVWARSAYVFRHAFTRRRRVEEERNFERSRSRYQDKFCGLQLAGSGADYELHCRGDACEHFAPPGAIAVHIQLPILSPPPAGSKPLDEVTAIPRYAGPNAATQPAVSKPDTASDPLVSCIMPTGGRADYAVQAARYFLRQDYPACELIIIDDGSDGLKERLPESARIRYFHVPAGRSIGSKRNLACEYARGEIIAQWDDDDWHALHRLRVQVEPIRKGQADVTGLRGTVFFDLEKWTFWKCAPALHRRLFVEDVHGGTLVFSKRIWKDAGGYPNRSLAEDAVFLRVARQRGARLQRIDESGLFLYVRHGENSWSFACGRHVSSRDWRKMAEPLLPADDRMFYARRSRAAGDGESQPAAVPSITTTAERPLVTCIMPTADRRPFVIRSLEYFVRQDYPNRELLILDDGADAIADVVPDDPRIRYVRLSRRYVLGEKRNYGCELARGSIIVHWDDDDWQAPHRIRYQVEELLKGAAAVCGLRDPLFFQPEPRRAWRYVYPDRLRPWVYGATLCFTRDYWKKHPFPSVSVGEDTRFVWKCRSRDLLALPASDFFVAMIHDRNSSPKRIDGRRWQTVAFEQIGELLGSDLQKYGSAEQAEDDRR